MAKAENLSGQIFGYMKAIKRCDDHISKSGQKKVQWLCECQLCGTLKAVNAQDLKSGKTISCGCYLSYKGKLNRNIKVCLICGNIFECSPSNKTVTCSKKCSKKYASIRNTGRAFTEDTRKKLSKKARNRDLSELQSVGTKAAKLSPKAGRFLTNINAIDWHLISPCGKHYYIHSLNLWLRENGLELFGCKPDSKEFINVRSGLSGAKRAMLGRQYSCCTYKGWQVIPTKDDYK